MRSGGANGIPVTDNVDDASGWTQVTRKSRPRSAHQQQTSRSYVRGQEDSTSGILYQQQTSSDFLSPSVTVPVATQGKTSVKSTGANGMPATDSVDGSHAPRPRSDRSASKQQILRSDALGQDPTSGIQKQQQTSSDVNGGSAGKVTLMIQVSLASVKELYDRLIQYDWYW